MSSVRDAGRSPWCLPSLLTFSFLTERSTTGRLLPATDTVHTPCHCSVYSSRECKHEPIQMRHVRLGESQFPPLLLSQPGLISGAAWTARARVANGFLCCGASQVCSVSVALSQHSAINAVTQCVRARVCALACVCRVWTRMNLENLENVSNTNEHVKLLNILYYIF